MYTFWNRFSPKYMKKLSFISRKSWHNSKIPVLFLSDIIHNIIKILICTKNDSIILEILILFDDIYLIHLAHILLNGSPQS